MSVISNFIMGEKKVKDFLSFPHSSLISVSKGTKKNMFVRILNLWGTFCLMVDPLDIPDVSESRFGFSLPRMRLNNWAPCSFRDVRYPEACVEMVQPGL